MRCRERPEEFTRTYSVHGRESTNRVDATCYSCNTCILKCSSECRDRVRRAFPARRTAISLRMVSCSLSRSQQLDGAKHCMTEPMLIIFAGLAGSGKTEAGKLLSQELRWPLLDKDTLTRPLAEAILTLQNRDIGDRESADYLNLVRPREYDCLLHTAYENLEQGISVIVTAPFLLEFNDRRWRQRLIKSCGSYGASCRIYWVSSDSDTMRSRVVGRGAPRDRWKVNNWQDYLDKFMPRNIPSDCYSLDNSTAALGDLAARIRTIAEEVRRGNT